MYRLTKKGIRNLYKWYLENSRYEKVSLQGLVAEAEYEMDGIGQPRYEMRSYYSKSRNPLVYDFSDDEIELVEVEK
jgi:hypothetical protein